MRIIVIACLFLVACGGTLSDEQRRKMREEMERHEIRRVTETQITEAAFAAGRALMDTVDRVAADSAQLDSMIRRKNGALHFLVPGKEDAMVIEQQLIEAYLNAETGDRRDNVQIIKNAEGATDSILYTRPVVISDSLRGVWNLWLSRKQLILSMDKD